MPQRLRDCPGAGAVQMHPTTLLARCGRAHCARAALAQHTYYRRVRHHGGWANGGWMAGEWACTRKQLQQEFHSATGRGLQLQVPLLGAPTCVRVGVGVGVGVGSMHVWECVCVWVGGWGGRRGVRRSLIMSGRTRRTGRRAAWQSRAGPQSASRPAEGCSAGLRSQQCMICMPLAGSACASA